jgi:hypothetical protein
VVLGVIYVGEKEEHKQGYKPEPRHPPQQPAAQQQQQTTPPPSIEEPSVRIDTCAHRRLVYGNPLLYDLIYCHHGDLPHIVDFSWRQQIYPKHEVDWDVFVAMIKRGLTLTFDQKMVPHSLNRHTFVVTFLHVDEGTGALVPKRIPTERIEQIEDDPCFAVRWTANSHWIKDELEATNTLLARGVEIEILVRGSRVWSTRGKALDGEFIAEKLPTGNGVQGGDFIDWFRVHPRGETKTKAAAYENF